MIANLYQPGGGQLCVVKDVGRPQGVVRTHAEGDGGNDDLDPVLRPL